ncbi:hypothetical protein FHS80_000199 [Porphyromonas circumdentaria]|nr:hypothetical protein [Porphyromonas circumdentaria]
MNLFETVQIPSFTSSFKEKWQNKRISLFSRGPKRIFLLKKVFPFYYADS